MKQSESNPAEKLSDEQLEAIKSLLNYPSLEEIFDPDDSRKLPAMRHQIQSTIDDLERVIRRGTKADAEKAVKAAEACQIVLGFLDELENLRQSQAK